MIYPVLMHVPAKIRQLTIRERNRALSRLARQCLEKSSMEAGLETGRFEKDGHGVPCPSNGNHWSVSHKPGMVAGIVSPVCSGIDIEQVRPVSSALYNRIVPPDEAACFAPEDRKTSFFRCFTAKEAVVKCQGVGLKGLKHVRVVRVTDEVNMELESHEKIYRIENFHVGEYLASIVKQSFKVKWTVENQV